MGKSQKKRNMRRHNPMRVPDSHLPKGLASASASSSKNEAILPIIQKLESVDPSERKWACVAVSNLIQNDPSTRRLLQGKNIVGALITRLSDSEEEVVVEATGSLRNLCIDGGFDICAEMYNKNILAPLKTFVPKISTTLSQFLVSPKNAPEGAQRLVYEFADNVITILWCLSANISDTHKVSMGIAQCLYILTDENSPIIDEVRSNAEYTACLLAIVRTPEAAVKANGKGKDTSDVRTDSLRVLCCGILRNISPIPPPSIAATIDLDRDVVLPTLEPVLNSIDLQEASQAAQHALDNQESLPQLEDLSLKHTPKSDHKTASELELERLETRLRTVQLALEILTGMCATLPDPEVLGGATDAGGQNDNEDDEGEEDVDESEDVDMAVDAPPSDTAPQPPPAFFTTLVAPVLKLVHPAPLSFPPARRPVSTPADDVGARRDSCLAPENGRVVFDAVWRALGTVGTDIAGAGQERRREMWDTGVGVLWGVGNVWKGALVPTEEQVQVLTQFCGATADSAVKVKTIGTLECLAQHPESVDANRAISSYLLSLLPPSATPPTPTEPLLQAVSALIDIYSDETLPYDVNFRSGRFLDALVQSAEGVRKAVRGIDRKKERELRVRGEEVRDNLVAFIQYRRGLRL
ncbi:hypothetical protein GSI_06011 [Ganoderma sinense ZZ0214-1]|uniref:SYO1-like TPR repeats domain-containing protein n=1 Tax=Ganoderma sinense ZZ0214-1 TaxID=1077348 RepID=A0A2G8SC44_9APHY|nr:hypothetical protein GSI_06011 [Ganoderma sinense ZZ0214-1]